MLKKIALGALLTGLTAVLILGAVNRTNAVSGAAAGESGRWGRAAESTSADAGLQSYGAGSSGQLEAARGEAAGGGRWAQAEASNEAASRGGRWTQEGAVNRAPAGQGAGVLSGQPEADVTPAEWRSVQTTVASVTDGLIELRTPAGEVIPFEGRPLSYALAQGLDLKVGDSVTLDGFDEDGEFKIGHVTSIESGASIVLRDTGGRPGWSGGRRQG